MPRVSLLVLVAVFLVFVPPSLQSQDPKPAGSPTTYAGDFQGRLHPRSRKTLMSIGESAIPSGIY